MNPLFLTANCAIGILFTVGIALFTYENELPAMLSIAGATMIAAVLTEEG